MTEFTNRWNGFQFRSVRKLNGEEIPYQYDLVKWQTHEPLEVINGKTGKKETITESCFSIARLVWDDHESWFNFESVGTRFLENYEEGLSEWILHFANMKHIEIKSEKEYWE